jgi:putative phosphoesterase
MTLIGIISDTHDNVINIKKAVDLFKKNNVDFVIHAGDVVAPASLKYFEGLKMKLVFGNCDGDRELIEKKSKELGFEHHGRIMELNISKKKIIVFHGDKPEINEKIINSRPDYFIHGHTHIPEDKMINNTRVLCPGGHYLGNEKESNKIIILDVKKDNTTFIQLE